MEYAKHPLHPDVKIEVGHPDDHPIIEELRSQIDNDTLESLRDTGQIDLTRSTHREINPGEIRGESALTKHLQLETIDGNEKFRAQLDGISVKTEDIIRQLRRVLLEHIGRILNKFLELRGRAGIKEKTLKILAEDMKVADRLFSAINTEVSNFDLENQMIHSLGRYGSRSGRYVPWLKGFIGDYGAVVNALRALLGDIDKMKEAVVSFGIYAESGLDLERAYTFFQARFLMFSLRSKSTVERLKGILDNLYCKDGPSEVILTEGILELDQSLNELTGAESP